MKIILQSLIAKLFCKDEGMEEPTPTIIPARKRSWLVAAFGTTIVLGLASRHYPFLFPGAFGKYPGDALWALMVYFGWGLVFPKKPMIQILFLTLATSLGVEFGKFYRVPWLNDFRETTIGHLLLGASFSWQNLFAYAVGASIGGVLDCWFLSQRNNGPQLTSRNDS
jgi:hypothetical protein